MKNNQNIEKVKKSYLKPHLNNTNQLELEIKENKTNSKGVNKKDIELYIPYTYEQLLHLNKKKYRDLKLNLLINHMNNAINDLYKAIDLYKELKDRTEFWEKDLTINFDFDSWNKIKKVNGKLSIYFKDLLTIRKKIDNERKKNA